jgi:hypothetical protein
MSCLDECYFLKKYLNSLAVRNLNFKCEFIIRVRYFNYLSIFINIENVKRIKLFVIVL